MLYVWNTKIEGVCIGGPMSFSELEQELSAAREREGMNKVCFHRVLHYEGKYCKFIVCSSCGQRWEHTVTYSQNNRQTRYIRIEKEVPPHE